MTDPARQEAATILGSCVANPGYAQDWDLIIKTVAAALSDKDQRIADLTRCLKEYCHYCAEDHQYCDSVMRTELKELRKQVSARDQEIKRLSKALEQWMTGKVPDCVRIENGEVHYVIGGRTIPVSKLNDLTQQIAARDQRIRELEDEEKVSGITEYTTGVPYDKLHKRFLELTKQMADLVGALEKYGIHKSDCMLQDEEQPEVCTCGWDDVLEPHRRQGK